MFDKLLSNIEYVIVLLVGVLLALFRKDKKSYHNKKMAEMYEREAEIFKRQKDISDIRNYDDVDAIVREYKDRSD